MPVYNTVFLVLVLLVLVCTPLLLLWQVIDWWRRPQPKVVTLMPAPRTRTGVVVRLTLETLSFRSLWRSGVWLPVLSLLLHYGLLWLLLIHVRLLLPADSVLAAISGEAGAWALLIGSIGLYLRRLMHERTRYISTLSDYAWLMVLMVLAISGMVLHARFPALGWQLGAAVRALPVIQVPELPAAAWVHMAFGSLLLMLLPFSKLLHGPGTWSNPALNSRDPGAL